MKKYIEIKNELKKFIENAKPHHMLPSHHQIMKKYGVSDITVRKALNELDKEGLIYTHHGKGRFVSPKTKFYPEVYCVFDSLNMDDVDAIDYIYPILVDSINTELINNNFEMLLSLYKDNKELDRQILERMPDKKPYGVILLYSGIKENLKYYEKAIDIIPNNVFVDRRPGDLKVSYVGSDNYKGASLMVNNIKDEEFDSILIISDFYRELSSDKERLKGYADSFSNSKNKDRITLFINDTLQPEAYLDNLSLTVTDYINKCNNLCMCFTNSYSFRYLYRKNKKSFEGSHNIKICVFDKPMKEIPKNLSITYANQDFRKIAKEAVRLITENARSSEEVLILPEIKKINF